LLLLLLLVIGVVVLLVVLLCHHHHLHHLVQPCGVVDRVQQQRGVAWSQKKQLFEWWLESMM